MTLAESAGWVTTEAGGLREARRMLARQSPRVIVARHQLADGFADHLLREIGADTPGRPRLIILASPGMAATEEARQVSLGADCVLRDPVRSEVLLAYLARYLRRAGAAPAPPAVMALAERESPASPRQACAEGKAGTLQAACVAPETMRVDIANPEQTADSSTRWTQGRTTIRAGRSRVIWIVMATISCSVWTLAIAMSRAYAPPP